MVTDDDAGDYGIRVEIILATGEGEVCDDGGRENRWEEGERRKGGLELNRG